MYTAYKKRTPQIFGNVRRPILGKPRTPLCCLAKDMGEKQTKLKLKISNTANNADNPQSQARDTKHR